MPNDKIWIVYSCGHRVQQFNEGGGKYKEPVIYEECLCDACWRKSAADEAEQG